MSFSSPGSLASVEGRSCSAPAPYELRLDDLALSVNIGCEASERARPQRVDVCVGVRFGVAPTGCFSDRLEDTLALEVVAERLRSTVAHGSFALIEHLAQRLYDVLRESCGPEAAIELSVTKVNPPIAGLAGGMTFRMAPLPSAAVTASLPGSKVANVLAATARPALELADGRMQLLARSDAAVHDAIRGEERRQAESVELIPSENYTYPEVLAALGSVFTDKYAEGYPGRRYYGGNGFADSIEELARERARRLFRAEHANVQPLSGSPMNQAAYLALLEPGDTILAMDLSHGGHLTHGAPVSHMARIFRFVRYRTRERDGGIDEDELLRLAREARPKLVLCGYTSYPRDYDYAAFRRVADDVGALLMADVSHVGGLIAGGALANPFEHGADIVTTTTHKTLRGPRAGIILCKREHARAIDRSVFPGLQGGPHINTIAGVAVALGKALQPEFAAYARSVLLNARQLADALLALGSTLVTGGTANHLLVLDSMRSFGLDGARAESVLERAGMTCNKQVIPDDPRPALRPSGIRLGTPAVTTRGMGPAEMSALASWLVEALQHGDDDERLGDIRSRCASLTQRFPIPGRQG
jgi:glycine hydroxymethyltransferase